MKNYNEQEVIDLLKIPERQHEAFRQIVEAYSEPLYWQIRRMVLSHDDANDILQNTFVKAWSNIDYFRGDAKISTWLYRIALNECLTFMNKRSLHSHLSIDEADTDMLSKLESDSYFDGNELQTHFLKAVHKLPEKQQIIFNLKYFKEMKYEEISAIMGTSIGALKASYHHAVKKIEAYLEKKL